MTVASEQPRVVYFVKPIDLAGPIKIGCSDNPRERLVSLTIWSPFPLELLGTAVGSYDDERFFHRCFSDLHSHHEWFRTSPALVAAINAAIAAGSIQAIRHGLVPKGNIPTGRDRPACRRFLSYMRRVLCAKMAKRRVPQEVDAIIENWRDRRPTYEPPSQTELALLEEFLCQRRSSAQFAEMTQ